MSQVKLTADSGGGTVALKGPTSTTGNAAIELTVPGTGNATLLTSASSTGKILQVKSNESSRDYVGSISLGTQSTPVDIPGTTVTITPSATTSKILVSWTQMGETSGGPQIYYFVLKRVISGGSTTVIPTYSIGNRTAVMMQPLRTVDSVDRSTTPEFGICAGYLDAPSTTSAVTYTVQIGNMEGTGTYYYNRTVDDGDYSSRERGHSWITVQEVAA